MDLEEWELLSDDGLVEINDDGGKMIFSRKYSSNSKNDFNMNYFICPSPKSPKFVDSTVLDDDHEVITKGVIITKDPNISEKIKVPNLEETMMEPEQEHVSSQVFLKKMKENEFETMKIDSPKSNNKTLLSQVDAEVDKEVMRMKKIDMEEAEDIQENNGGLNLLTGFGAICSFGVAAAATICIFLIGNRQKHKQNQKLRFQFFSDDKRIKQVVHHATRLNEAISGMRVPVTRARISVGGYYDAL